MEESTDQSRVGIQGVSTVLEGNVVVTECPKLPFSILSSSVHSSQ